MSTLSQFFPSSSVVVATPPGYLGSFGNGAWRIYSVAGSWTYIVPSGVTNIRVRVIGAGGGGATTWTSDFPTKATGGAGGGYAHGEFAVTAGTSYTVTVGAGGLGGNGGAFAGTAGGSTSFGALISATGGGGGLVNSSSPNNGGAGGTGLGGTFQASGGRSTPAQNTSCTGGSGAGSQLGDGGTGFLDARGGSAVLIGASGGNGASPFSQTGEDIFGELMTATVYHNRLQAVIRFPFDGFTGGGTVVSNSPPIAGIGAGGAANTGSFASGPGGIGGGGGSSFNNASGITAGTGGFGGGGGGGGGVGGCRGGDGGRGLVIVEW